MEVKHVLALPEGLEVAEIEMNDELLTVTVVSTQISACCPLCSEPALRIHSHYIRQIADLPCGGQRVRFQVLVRKYFCERTICQRKIFTERVRRCALIPLVGGVQHHWSKYG